MINLKAINKDIYNIVSRLNKEKFEAYLVGGAVRDLLLGITPKDFDISTNATPNQLRRIFPQNSDIIGKRFKIIHIKMGKEIFEVSTFRRQATKEELAKFNKKKANNIIWQDNYWGTLKDDAPRRDFSVNAIYYNPIDDKINDPVNGLNHLHNRKVCSLGQPAIRFQEDPIRMLRALKLVAQYDFTLSNDIVEAIQQHKHLLSFVSQRRLFEEIIKITKKPYLSKMLLLMQKHRLLSFVLPQLPQQQLKAYLKLTNHFDKKFETTHYSKSYSLALLSFPFVHYQMTKNNDFKTPWTISNNWDKKLSHAILSFYSPYTLMHYNTIKIKNIFLSLQKLMNQKEIKSNYYATQLKNAIGTMN